MAPIISQVRALEIIQNGGVVAVPTETAYGLVTDATNDTAVQKIYTIKGRSEAKPILVLVNSLEMAMRYAEFSDKALELAQKYWPGPLTLVLYRRNNSPQPPLSRKWEGAFPLLRIREGEGGLLSSYLNLADNTIGVRWTSNEVCQHIITQLGKPITAPSANVTGMKTCYTVDEIQAQYEGHDIQPDGIVDGGMLHEGEVSTLAKVIGDRVGVIRQGSINV
ncbi:MAG: hypothetical protein A3H59_03890 [Candidatus Jacksonbacteria bacterium RIFCSPLOWO2_02_FULL_43_9]|nr:MAG: Sua5/YciO/YrdC/YwlC family protein [Parcubacteria group bacterium GW2011_GWA2_43_13]OGY69141.1 MAG: hypothetical protein A3B94_03650 [Candidatus Jacksonbacteria bacterium RIFCSPHIGHO2_02_FULL_43_10]OGY70160.1 MAG: hypothetical protein A2986_03595 [Candidatus Jacksonbacteria bacterium RIFCSPLOWO2_01_FULL_44_13]OGY72574.1 MAG: hypothetical protein A3H59_03890 [Candidatus Jacksonbacteria bacterium RIFCSPLOWO2_02_FULL_43_9]HAZ16726.1 hypothetical protein [Candidatus Jacksonbacteria bacteriu